MRPLTPRRKRVLNCLLERPHSTTELEFKCYIRYSPDVIATMKKLYGLDFHCRMVDHVTVDKIKTKYGIYSLLDSSVNKARELLGIAPTTPRDKIGNLAKSTDSRCSLPQTGDNGGGS